MTLIAKAKALQERLDIFKLKYAGMPGCPKDSVTLDADEAAQIDEIRAKRRATEYFDSIETVYILFASIQTKEYVAGQMQSPYAFLDVKALRIGSLGRLSKFCSKLCRSNPKDEESEAESLPMPGGALNGDGKKYGAIYIEEDDGPGTGYYAGEYREKPDGRMTLSEVPYHPSNVNWSNYNGDIPNIARWICSMVAVGLTVLAVSLSVAAFQEGYQLTDNEYVGVETTCPRTVSLEEADETANQDARYQVVETLACYCSQQYESVGFASLTDKPNLLKACQDWEAVQSQAYWLWVGPGLLAVLIVNGIGGLLNYAVWFLCHRPVVM
jgi:hypothetical protein